MKQRVTRALFDYWDSLRGARPAPDRRDIDPGAIRSCLANTFILSFDPEHGHPFRIAGTSLCEMFGGELTGKAFSEFWTADQQSAVSDLIRTVAQGQGGAVAAVAGENTDAETADLEMILLPLASGAIGTGRILGAMTVVSAPYWFRTRSLRFLRLGDLYYIGARGDDRRASDQTLFRDPDFIVDPAATTPIPRNYHG
jgi:hypothetical protein